MNPSETIRNENVLLITTNFRRLSLKTNFEGHVSYHVRQWSYHVSGMTATTCEGI